MIPLSLQGLLQNVATTVDSLMLGVISKSAMSAAAIAVVFLNFHVMFLIAIGTTLSAMMAREYSNGNNTIIKKINTISMVTGFIITVIFFVLIFLVLTIIFASKYVDHNNVTITLFIIIIIISSINLYVGILTTMIQGATLIPGGDIVVNLFIDLGFSLFYAAPLLIFGYVVSYHYLILYIILLKSDEIVKYPLIRYRSRQNKWLKY